MTLKRILIAVVISLGTIASAHARNPGTDATQCVQVSEKNGHVTFTNTCNRQIFVIWCGNQAYTKKRCGDGPKGGYFTHSANLKPGADNQVLFRGQYRYGACVGSISFGNDGKFEDDARGRFRCLPG